VRRRCDIITDKQRSWQVSDALSLVVGRVGWVTRVGWKVREHVTSNSTSRIFDSPKTGLATVLVTSWLLVCTLVSKVEASCVFLRTIRFICGVSVSET
jgi:hypothetical protein